MKMNNPKSRFKLNIGKKERVLEVGGGHNPHPRSNVVVDKYIDSNYHRQSDIHVLKHQEFLQADGENLPFVDNEFDYVICNQVLEHVENPEAFLKEQMRVSKRGYIETPSVIGEYLFPKEAHKWLILELDGKIIMVEKSKVWAPTGPDFGFIFLTWLQKTSLAYKLLTATRPDIITMRYEWSDTIEFVINPEKEEYLKYFTLYWDEQMATQFFPEKSKSSELKDVLLTLIEILTENFKRKFKN
jgi:SAM-dependent methyltransferase